MKLLELRPIGIREASAFVNAHHRHHRAPRGAKFAIGVWHQHLGRFVGVVMVGRPVSRMLDDGLTAEVTRLATDGTRNAGSMLYQAAKRAAQALGYRRVLTYTLPDESGASLRGAGWIWSGQAGGGLWSRPSRPRSDNHPTQVKIRWEASTELNRLNSLSVRQTP